MPSEQKPKATPPLKSERKLLIGLAVLIVLMFVLFAAIVINLTDNKP
jgi:hypothetical protein